MPYYITPPMFSPGQILTASQLNVLSGDIEYLNSLSDYLNIPFSKYVYGTLGEQNMAEAKWMFIHRHQYLHYYMTIDTGDLNSPVYLKINWGPGEKTLLTITSSLTSPQTYASYIDIQATLTAFDGSVIPLGAKMETYWAGSTDGTATAHYFLESSFTVI
jgi:hypothetical protein